LKFKKIQIDKDPQEWLEIISEKFKDFVEQNEVENLEECFMTYLAENVEKMVR
jgi:hypothetical protein